MNKKKRMPHPAQMSIQTVQFHTSHDSKHLNKGTKALKIQTV